MPVKLMIVFTNPSMIEYKKCMNESKSYSIKID